MTMDSVHQKENGKWAFWDESWSYEFGDFNTQREAQYELDRYSKEYLGNPENLSGRTKLVCNVCKTDWTTPNNQVGCKVCGKGTYGYVVLKDPVISVLSI